jgi:hypothetical protein
MNKKSQRHTLHAPTTQPVGAIAPSGTAALDGELPHTASIGVTAPEPLAAHDVLHAAMVQPDPTSSTTTEDEHGAAAVNDPDIEAETEAVTAAAEHTNTDEVKPAKGNTKKAKKKGASADTAPADPLAAAVAPKVKSKVKSSKEKFVACSFTLPQSEAAVLSAMKKTHQANGVNVKKSQLLRAALLHLADVDSTQLAHLVAQLPQPPLARKKKK